MHTKGQEEGGEGKMTRGKIMTFNFAFSVVLAADAKLSALSCPAGLSKQRGGLSPLSPG